LIGVAIFEMLKNKYLSTPQGEQIGLKPKKSALTENINLIDEKEPNSKKRLFLSIGGVIFLFLLFSVNFSSLFGGSTETLFSKTDWIGSIIYAIGIMMPLFIISDNSLTKVERLRILVIFIISFFVIFFWSAFEQAGASLTFFADEQTNRNILGWEMPASYFQSFNAIFVVALAPLFALLWSLLGKRGVEPSSPVKQSIGLFLLSLGYLVIAFGVRGVDSHMKVSILWLTGLYFIHTMGELCLSPIGLSIVNKLAPARFASLLMAVWFLSNAIANKFAGTLSGLYPENGTTKSFVGYQITTLFDFFMLFVVMSGVAAIILFGLSKWLEKLMGGVK